MDSGLRITNTVHKNLDGLRAIGILMVIAQHFFGELLGFSICWISIDLLFALSGLLITGILIETTDDPKYFKKFYMRRILRIFPLYYLLMGLFAVYAWLVTVHPEATAYFRDNIIYFLTYTQNWYFIDQGMPPAGHVNHTWSLAVDEQIYLVWPFLIWLIRKPKQLIALCTIVILGSLVYRISYNFYLAEFPPVHEYPYFHNTFCRVDSFAAGALLYCVLRFRKHWLTQKVILFIFSITLLSFIGVGLLDNSFKLNGPLMRNIGYTIVGIHCSTWLWYAIEKQGNFSNFLLGNPVIRYIGKISYSLYVFHLFLLLLLVSRVQLYFIDHWNISSLAWPLVICLFITFAVSIVSYEFFEKPMVRLKRKFSYKRIS